MDREQIDELFEALENDDIEKLLELSEVKIEYNDFITLSNEEQSELGDTIFRNIFSKIDIGDFEYFKSKIRSIEVDIRRDILMEMQEYSKHFREYAIEIINGSEKLNIPLQSDEIYDLIKGIDATDSSHSYAKDCIEGKIAVEIDIKDIVRLLRLINDVEYTKNIIEQKEEILFELDPYEVLKMENPGLIETYVRKMKDGNESKISNWELVKLIKSTGNEEFIKEAIDGTLGVQLDGNDVVRLIEDNENLIKEVIEGKIELRRGIISL